MRWSLAIFASLTLAACGAKIKTTGISGLPTPAALGSATGTGTATKSTSAAGKTGTTTATGTATGTSTSTSNSTATTAAKAPVVTAPALTNQLRPTWSWTSGGGKHLFRYKLDDASLATAPFGAEVGFAPPFDLTPGSHTLYVQEMAADGLWSATGSAAVTVDPTAPTATLATGVASLTGQSPWDFTATFSKVVTGFTAAGLTVTNGTVSGFTGSGTTYHFTVTPGSQGSVTVALPASAATDAAGNGNAAATPVTIAYDSVAPTAPTVTIAGVSTTAMPTWSWTGGGGGNGTFRYALDDATLANPTTVAATSFTPASALSEGSHTLYVQERDAAGNWSTAGSAATTVDTVSPGVTLATAVTSPTNTSPWTVTVTFTRSVTGFTASNLSVTNGTASGLSGSGASYSVTVTPSAEGTVTIGLPAGTVSDGTGHTNSAATPLSLVYDTTAPNAPSVSGPASTNVTKPTWSWSSGGGGGNATYRYKLDDATLTSGATQTTGTSYTPASALAAGAHVLYVQERDTAGNWSASGSATITIDTSAPTVTLATTATSPTNTSPVPVTATFSESVTGFSTAGLTVTNATVTGFAGSGTSYSFNLVPSGQGAVSVTAKAGAGTDAAGNPSQTSSALSVTYDTAAPSAPSVTAASPTNNTQPTWSWTSGGGGSGTYRYALDDASLASPTVAAATSFTAGSTLAAGNHTLYVQEEDAAGNWSTSGSATVTIDTTAPTATLATGVTSPTNAASWSFTATFSKSVTGFTSSDLSVTNGTVSGFSGSGTSYAFTVTPTAEGAVQVSLPAGGAADAAGNGNTAATPVTITYDVTPPGAPTVSGPTPTNNTQPTWSWSSGGSGNGTYRYALDDAALTSPTVVAATSFTPGSALAAGTHTLYVQERDAAGNWSSSGSAALTIDTTQPTVTLSTAVPTPTNTSPWTITVTFSKSVTGFAASDVNVTNGSAGSLSGSGASYTVSVTPSADGAVTIALPAGVASDAAGNGNAAAVSLALTYDTTAPTAPGVTCTALTNNTTPTWSWSSGGGGGSGTYRYKLDDPTLTSGATQTTGTTFTPGSALSAAAHVLYVQEQDAAGNWSASGSCSTTVDTTAPTVTLSTSVTSPSNASPWAFTATFSESVTGFAAGDLTVTNGTVSGLSGSGTTYTFNVTPTGQGAVQVSLPAGGAQDGAGNGNAAATPVSITYDTVAPSAPSVTGPATTSNTTPTWTWSSGGGGGNGTYRYKLDDATLTSGATQTTSASYTPGSALSTGNHTLYVQEEDAAGNWSASGSFTVDVQPPAVLTDMTLDARDQTGSANSGDLKPSTSASWTDLAGDRTVTLSGFTFNTAASGWDGTGTTANPYRLKFDGSSTSINAGTVNPVYLSVWFKITASDNIKRTIAQIGNTEIFAQGSTVYVCFENFANCGVEISSYFGANTWNNVIVQGDGSNWTPYFNGQAGGSIGTSGSAIAQNTLYIGSHSDGTQIFQGEIALVQVGSTLFNATTAASYYASITPTVLPAPYNRVFLSSTAHDGNFGALDTSTAKGLVGADLFCQSRANAASLTGTWRAILSDGTSADEAHLYIFGHVYDMAGNLLANDNDTFFKGTALQQGIGYDEFGNAASGTAWTGSTTTGTNAANHCSAWKTNSNATAGQVGTPSSTTGWQNNGSTSTCDQTLRVYCLSQ